MNELERSISQLVSLILEKVMNKLESEIRPVMIGLTGLQGSGKSAWASGIVRVLHQEYGLTAIHVSLDDFYLSYDKLVELRRENPNNRLLRTRGQPGTHDEVLAGNFFNTLRAGVKNIPIPQFDKSLLNGKGHRINKSQWPIIAAPPDVVVFEGWCIGFQPLSTEDILSKRCAAKQNARQTCTSERLHTLQDYSIEQLEELDASLARYNQYFMGLQYFDIMLQLSTQSMVNVYRWRTQQEHALLKATGSGMTDEQVSLFVQGYMPAYELYLDELRSQVLKFRNFKNKPAHVLISLSPNREVMSISTS